jgi:hypothetical protein
MHMQVGRSMIADLNLTRFDERTNHAFMSLEDFVSVISSHKGVFFQLLERFPDVVYAIWRGTDIYQHVLRLWDAAQQHVVVSYLDSVWSAVLNGSEHDHRNRTFTAADIEAVRRIVRNHERQIELFHVYSGGGILPRMGVPVPPVPVNDRRASAEVVDTSSSSGRKILQAASEMSTVDTYTSLVASSRGFSNLAIASFQRSSDHASPLVTETWLEGPFGWPPKYSTLAEAGQCPAVDQLLESTGEVCSFLFCSNPLLLTRTITYTGEVSMFEVLLIIILHTHY